MKKVFIFAIFALAFSGFDVNAQVTEAVKKAGTATKQSAQTGVRKTRNGIGKGWTIGKKIGQKAWRKGKGITSTTYKAGKKAVKKVT